jgi:CheY-like chemotaxis protein
VAEPAPILVVDDDPAIRELICETLADEGWSCVGAADGGIALDFVGQRPPSLILLDMRMPRVNGWEFAEEYRKMPGPHAPIVVVTAGGSAADKAREIAADAYLPKPFDLDKLVALVEQYLR